jgi:putative FmdB family regulatory protein
MATYEYRCEHDGLFDVILPLGTAPESTQCPACGVEAKRAISAPMVRRGSQSAWFAAMDHAEKSRHEPDVVTSLPATGALRPRQELKMTPALWNLPRP